MKRPNIVHINGREINKENYPEDFNFYLIAGTLGTIKDPIVDYDAKAHSVKLGDPDLYKYNYKRLANDP